MPLDMIDIRRPGQDDYAVMANILVDGWRVAYKDIVADDYLQNLSTEHFCRRMTENKKDNAFLVAKANDEVVAFCRYSLHLPSDEQNGFDGAISVLYVKPDLKHNGIGTKLFKCVMQDFKQNGNSCVILGCFSQNSPSLAFYEKMGGKFIYEKDIEIGGVAYSTAFYQFKL